MFGFLKSSMKLVAPIAGKVIDLSQVPDEVFASKMAGDGVAIDSVGDVAVAPADGEIILIFKTNHAFCMRLDNGLELLIHIGIDTVELKGEGFERLVEEGVKVKAGQPIIKVDRIKVVENGYSLITPLLITNMDLVKDIKYLDGTNAKAGKDAVLTYKTK